MLHYRHHILVAIALMLMIVPVANAQDDLTSDLGRDKLAQTSFKFLKISPDARAAALGDAMTSLEMHSSMAMFYNPAGMARIEGNVSAGFSMTNWIANINYNAASVAVNTGIGVFGVSVLAADYGDDFIGTVVSSSPLGYTEYSELGLSNPTPTALSVGLGYAVAITDRFAVGANIKYASQDLGVAAITSAGETQDNEESTLAYDFGVLYDTGFRSLKFALSVRNFSQELTYVDENFELPLTFNVGLSMDMTDLMANIDPSQHAFNVMLEAERPRDFSEQLKVGGEYTFMNILSLRAGYVFPTDEQGISLGGGLQYGVNNLGIGVDYAYTSFGVFDNVNRLGVHLSF